MEKINVKLIWIAVAISLICTFLFYQYLSSLERKEEDKKYTEIIIAKQDILPNTKITEGIIEKKKILVENSLSSENITSEQIIGKYVKEKILKGEEIKKQRLVDENEKDLAMKVPEGKRALSVQVNEYIAVGDLIKPGNYVDVYCNLEEKTVETAAGKVNYINQTKLILQNIQVLSISKQYTPDEKDREKTPTAYSITLAVTPIEAEKLIYSEAFGTIKLVLRPVNENGMENIVEVNEVSMRN